MATSVHSDGEEQAGEAEPGEDGYWPALEILGEKKYEYLVNWDGTDPETGRPWPPSWTRKTEVTDDLIEAWEGKKAAKKKRRPPAPKKQKKPRAFTVSTPRKPVARGSRSSRTSLVPSSRATGSPVISLGSDDGSRVSRELALGKRKRQSTRHPPADDDPKPVPKKQRVDVASSSTSQKSRTKSIRSLKHVNKETIDDEDEIEVPVEVGGPDKASRSSSNSKAGTGSSTMRIGPPRRHKKVTPLPSAATPSSPRGSNSAFKHLQEEEEENTQEAAGIAPKPVFIPPPAKKKKRRLKTPLDVRPKPPAFAVEATPVPPSRDASLQPQEPFDQEEPFEASPLLPGQDGEPAEPLPGPTPPRAARQQASPEPPFDDPIFTPTPPRAKKKTKTLGPVPKLHPSHFEPYLQVADTTSIIDEFSPMKLFATQDTVEPSIQDSQDLHVATEPLHQSFDPAPVDDPLDVEIAKKMQDVQDAYFDFDGRANEVPHEAQPTTDPGSTERDPPRSQSPVEHAEALVPVRSFNSQKLEDALVILNQKSEEIEGLEAHLAAQEAQIEHLQAENDRIQAEFVDLSIKQGVQREALDDANVTVSELGIHIDWLQGLLNESEAKGKQLQAQVDEIQNTLNAKVEEHNLARAEWEQERAALEARLSSLADTPPQQPPVGWELEKKELEDKLAEVTDERNEVDKAKRYAENEVETWKEEYRKRVVESQEARQEAKDAKAETSRIREEKVIIASQTKESVRLITAKYEAIVAELKTKLAKAESLYKVLQTKDEQTGDDIRSRAALTPQLREEVRRLRGEFEVIVELHRKADLKSEGNYPCRFSCVDGVECGQSFGSPQELYSHTKDHIPSRGQR